MRLYSVYGFNKKFYLAEIKINVSLLQDIVLSIPTKIKKKYFGNTQIRAMYIFLF